MNKSEIPRNEFDWEGGVVLLDPVTKVFYLIGFGNGTNADDLCEGCDDYLYLEYGHLIRNEIQDEDGGQLFFWLFFSFVFILDFSLCLVFSDSLKCISVAR